MNNKENLFEEFPETNEKEWIEKVEKDLKGRSFKELFWSINEDLNIAPFYYNNDQIPSVPANKTKSNSWEISEDVFVENPKSANQQLLNALANGVNAPRLIIDTSLDGTQMATLFQHVELSYISIHFLLKSAKLAIEILEVFNNYLVKKNINKNEIKGSINHSDDDQLAELIQFAIEKLPSFKTLTINIEDSNPADISKSLAQSLVKGNDYLTLLYKKGINPNTTNNHLQFSIPIGKSYFIEIAKIRALKILWANILEVYGIKDSKIPAIEAHLSEASFGEDPNTNMIRATTQAMSAALGGVNRLTVLPSDANQGESTDFSRRIARNVQHLLMMESFFDRVIDPAKGSYYIEKLTEKIAEAAWSEFQKMEQNSITENGK